MLLNCGVGEDSWESLGLQGDQSWMFIGRTDAEAETAVLWPPHVKSWLTGKTLTLGRIGGRRRRGWQRMRWLVASLTRWAWIWVNSRSWWWTGKPGMLQSMGSQSRTQLSNWTELMTSQRHGCGSEWRTWCWGFQTDGTEAKTGHPCRHWGCLTSWSSWLFSQRTVDLKFLSY